MAKSFGRDYGGFFRLLNKPFEIDGEIDGASPDLFVIY
jgi:hypothetical protein